MRHSLCHFVREIEPKFRYRENMQDLSYVGRRIRYFRGVAGLTLAELGEAVGVVPSQLSLIENGRREPRLALLSAIAARLGVTVADLIEPTPPSGRDALEVELER